MNVKIPRSGLTRKPVPLLEDQAADLVEAANDAADHYVHYTLEPSTALNIETVEDAVAWGFLLASLRTRSKEIVGEAFAQRFQMSKDDFAVDILRG